jgi:hypothetical protein
MFVTDICPELNQDLQTSAPSHVCHTSVDYVSRYLCCPDCVWRGDFAEVTSAFESWRDSTIVDNLYVAFLIGHKRFLPLLQYYYLVLLLF